MGHSFQQYSFVTSVASVFNFQTPIHSHSRGPSHS